MFNFQFSNFPIILVCLFLISCSDKAYQSKLIVGTWECNVPLQDGSNFSSRETYYENGILNQLGLISMGDIEVAYATSANWSIDNSLLKTTTTSSTVPDIVPVGYEQVDLIVSIDKTTLTIHQETADVKYTCNRAK